jgi:hypothetical protein
MTVVAASSIRWSVISLGRAMVVIEPRFTNAWVRGTKVTEEDGHALSWVTLARLRSSAGRASAL